MTKSPCIAALAMALPAAVTALSLSVAAQAPAVAAVRTERVSDPRGDAPARADVTTVVATAAATSFHITIKIRNLGRRGSFVLGTGVGGWGYDWTVTKTEGGTRVRVLQVAETHTDDLGVCASAHVSWNARRDVVRATLPYSCTGSATDYAPWGGMVFRSRGARDNVGDYWPATRAEESR